MVHIGGAIAAPGDVLIGAPAAGWLDALTAVPDPVFADGMMGDGAMIDPVDGLIVAPADAEVVGVARTGHSVTLRLGNGAELLIHVGVDTVTLGGQGFASLVGPGERVAAGAPLIRCDLDLVARAGRSLRTPVLVTNDGYMIADRAGPGLVERGAPIFAVRAVRGEQRTATTGGERHEARLQVNIQKKKN